MKKFVRITGRNEDGIILKSWRDTNDIESIYQTTEQEGQNEATLFYTNGDKATIINFSQTLEDLK
jgi:hypothetical protein